MNKNIIIAILVVVIIAAAAAFMFGHNSKTDTQINFLSGNTLKNGEQVQFELKDTQGNPISGQQVNLTFGEEKYSLVTDGSGKGSLTLNGENAGKYDVTVNYGGDDKHNGCTGKITININDDSTADSSTTSTTSESNSSSTVSSDKGNSELNYDAEHDVYYDNNGKIHGGGQLDGMQIDTVRQKGGPFEGIH